MSKKICCFAGHREIYDGERVFFTLKNIIEHLILHENITEFLVGNYGNFDMLAARCIKTLKKKYTNIKLILIIPYRTQQLNKFKEYYKEYDDIIVADIPDSTPAKFKILKCNEYMIKQSDFLICYVKYSWGGASKTLEYAQKQHIKILNINDILKDTK